MASSAQTLITAAYAAGFDALSNRDLMECLLYSASNFGGGSGAGGVFSGAYGVGQPPNFTPSTSAAIATNTSDGVQWNWYSGAWV